MKTNEFKERDEKEWEWSWRNLVDDDFKENMKKKLSFMPRAIRVAVILGVFLHFFAFGIVPSLSMYPTLAVNDLVLYQRANSYDRGDVVFFEHPTRAGDMYVKRIIGMPGDEVEVKGGFVYVNGEALREEYVSENPEYEYARVVVPSESYFVLGDNRNDSEDSTNFGFITHKSINGKAIAIVMPLNRFRLFS